jgi:DNA-directed RNA polymerase specialized sigma24 family protein
MRYLLDMTPGEIAAALDLPRGTVNSRLRRGLDALGETLRREAAPELGAPATPDRDSVPRLDDRERQS